VKGVVTCGTAYAQVARGGSKGDCESRQGRPYGLSEETTREADDAIVAGSSSVHVQLEDTREREAIQVETFPAVCLLPVASPHINTPLANLACRYEIHSYPVCTHYNTKKSHPFVMATPDQQKQLQALSDEYTALQTGTSIGPTHFQPPGHLLMAIL
jgi:hypothetical protein